MLALKAPTSPTSELESKKSVFLLLLGTTLARKPLRPSPRLRYVMRVTIARLDHGQQLQETTLTLSRLT